LGHTKNWCKRKDNPICRDCATPMHTGMCLSPKKCVNCNPPEMAVIRIKIELDISYGLARKKFEEQFDRKKETYEQVTGRNEDQM
jgi:hypothetical protein